ncbi:ABC transporter ATP-binding protein [uncultured Desulfosarcina sp.]|uniref:ABC transporter ATP-binding protein n=1 Tax=uncultured Desulfosarcina sp. TaxID=218289 RepID=UPI0029C6B7A9|nr:ABC transporter ATP-binding protein [uncultured Desulfosarcina sp.]
MLRLDGFSCGYGPMRAVDQLQLQVASGSVTALLGANGSGKSSTIMCIAGHVEMHGGSILYEEADISALSPMARVAAGIGLVPEGRRLFSSLTVRENLVVGGYCRPGEATAPTIEKVLATFPRLGERLHQRAGSLSGGEQQMLAIGRALMSQPKLLLVDELSLGLMPKMIDACYGAIDDLKTKGMAILLVEQSTQRALEVADTVTVLESGLQVWTGTARQARRSTDMIDACLGLKHKSN